MVSASAVNRVARKGMGVRFSPLQPIYVVLSFNGRTLDSGSSYRGPIPRGTTKDCGGGA